jgi:hypothetical protein
MTTFVDGHGLGMFDMADFYGRDSVGHLGENVGYVSAAGCLTEQGTVFVVLSNRAVDDVGGMARPLVDALLSE